MKGYLIWKNSICAELDVVITPKECKISSAFCIQNLPLQFPVLLEAGSDSKQKLGRYLTTRIPKRLKDYSREELLRLLDLWKNREEFLHTDLQEYLFLPALLWYLETGDSLSFYPVQTEYLDFTGIDSRFCSIYRLSGCDKKKVEIWEQRKQSSELFYEL